MLKLEKGQVGIYTCVQKTEDGIYAVCAELVSDDSTKTHQLLHSPHEILVKAVYDAVAAVLLMDGWSIIEECSGDSWWEWYKIFEKGD